MAYFVHIRYSAASGTPKDRVHEKLRLKHTLALDAASDNEEGVGMRTEDRIQHSYVGGYKQQQGEADSRLATGRGRLQRRLDLDGKGRLKVGVGMDAYLVQPLHHMVGRSSYGEAVEADSS